MPKNERVFRIPVTLEITLGEWPDDDAPTLGTDEEMLRRFKLVFLQQTGGGTVLEDKELAEGSDFDFYCHVDIDFTEAS
jgi:hypothetical protein